MVRRKMCTVLGFGLALILALPAGAAAAADRYLVVMDHEKGAAADTKAMVESLGGKVVRSYPEIGVAVVSSDEPSFGRHLAMARGVMGVNAEVKRETSWSRELDTLDGFVQGVRVSGPPGGLRTAAAGAQGAVAGTDNVIRDPRTVPFWPFQWNMQRMGLNDVFGIPFYGDPDVKVALLGAGVDYRHPDLVGKVDLDLSRSFVESDDILVEQLFPGAHPVADLAFHTTFVAAQITCTVRFLGCVAPAVSLVGVKVLDIDEFGTVADVVSGIMYASEIHADVIAMPWAMWGPADTQWNGRIWNMGNAEDRVEIIAMQRAIAWAKSHGAVVVADASVPFGMPGIDADADGLDVILPAQAGATAIGSSGRFDTYGHISNFGFTLVDAVAPGGFVDPDNPPAHPREFIWGACSSFSQFGRLKDECAIQNQPQFIIIIGPLVSVGHAAGVAALIASRYPGMPPAFLTQKLLHTAVDIETPGPDAFTGFGRVDAWRAIQ